MQASGFCLKLQQAETSPCSTPSFQLHARYCGGGGAPTAMLLLYLHLYEAQTPSLRSLGVFTALCIHNLFLLLFNQSLR